MRDVHIRVAGSADQAALAALVAGFRDHLGVSSPSDAEIAAALPAVLADPAIEFAGAFSPAGTPLGYTHTRYHTSLWSPGLGGHLEDLFVVESARGAGLGRALLEFALDLARNRGARFLSLTTNENNTNARGLYSSAGFRLQQEPRYDDGREICFVHPLQDGEQEGAPK